MAEIIDVEIINPFIQGTMKVMSEAAQINLKMGKPSVKSLSFTDDKLRIIVGITGQMTGNVIISLSMENAKKIASAMMTGMPVEELNDMAKSAISELGNMIMGTSSTIIAGKGLLTDITPPVIERGESYMDVKNLSNICIPMLLGEETFMELNIVVKKN